MTPVSSDLLFYPPSKTVTVKGWLMIARNTSLVPVYTVFLYICSRQAHPYDSPYIFICYDGAKLWNSLPADMRDSDTLPTFINATDAYNF